VLISSFPVAGFEALLKWWRPALLLSLSILVVSAADPPPGLLKKIAARETENSQARANYTYRQSVTIQEFDDSGKITGEYREVREITFSPTHGRYERFLEQPRNGLTRIKLTEQDFADIRNIQPFLLTNDNLFLYEGKYKGEQEMDGEMCFIEDVRPRQILSTERFFEGTLWVRESDLSVVRSEGQAVPQIETLAEQNLFPHFTTLRRPIDDKWWFPVETYADDTLFFRQHPQRIRITIRYMDYKRFSADSTITFGDEKTKPK
jgi:hypothetical protein